MTNSDSTLVKWAFLDLHSDHDVLELCKEYLRKLEELVDEAAKNFDPRFVTRPNKR